MTLIKLKTSASRIQFKKRNLFSQQRNSSKIDLLTRSRSETTGGTTYSGCCAVGIVNWKFNHIRAGIVTSQQCSIQCNSQLFSVFGITGSGTTHPYVTVRHHDSEMTKIAAGKKE
uniref:Uncharacterized protein n=1 Tax=Glossina palpalis gambiensis TaxID=67801 RepID=A0A1B0B5S8_9MUSC